MTIELITYTPDFAQDLADFYNDQILGVPHCHATGKNNWKEVRSLSHMMTGWIATMK